MDVSDLYERNVDFLNYLRKNLVSDFISGNFFSKSMDYKDKISKLELSYKRGILIPKGPGVPLEARQIPTIAIPPTIIRGFYQIADIFSFIRDNADYSEEIYPAIEAYRENDFGPMIKLLFISISNQKMDKISIKMGLQLLFYILFGCELYDNLYEFMEYLISLKKYEKKIKKAKERYSNYMVFFNRIKINTDAPLPAEGASKFIEFISAENWKEWINE